MLWDATVQCDRRIGHQIGHRMGHRIGHRKPDMVEMNKKGGRLEGPGRNRIKETRDEKLIIYDDGNSEIRRLWSMEGVDVRPIIFGALGNISQRFQKNWYKKKMVEDHLPKLALVESAGILGQVLEV